MNTRLSLILAILSLTVAGLCHANAGNPKPASAPYGFIENKGQVIDENRVVRPDVLFTYDAPNARLFFFKDKIVYAFYRFEEEETEAVKQAMNEGDLEKAKKLGLRIRQERIDFEFVGTQDPAKIAASNPGGPVVNYYYSHCPEGIRDLPVYTTLTYTDIYPNIDLIFKVTPSGMKYDIVLRPGARLTDIRFRYNGAQPLSIEEGQLFVNSEICHFSETIPASFLQTSGEKLEVNFKLYGDNIFGFQSEHPAFTEPAENIIIDPSVSWSTYFERSTAGPVSCIRGNDHVDANGNFFYQLNTYSPDLPLANPGGSVYFDPSYNPASGLDIYFAKFDIDRNLVWSTYLGGSEGTQDNYYDHGLASYNGYLYITGTTEADNFPCVNQGGGAYYYNTQGATVAGFLSKFNIATGQMVHSTYLRNYEQQCIAIDGNGNIAIISFQYTFSVAPTIVNRAGAYNQSVHGGDSDIFLYMFNNNLVQTWGTYIGGAGYSDCQGLAFDSNNNLFLHTRHSSNNAALPLVNPGGGAYYQTTIVDKYDCAITKFNTSGAMVWSTYYGGSGLEGLSYSTIKINDANDVIIVSTTRSTDLPVQNQGGGAYYQGTPPVGLNNGWGGDPGCGFIVRFNNNGVRQHATYIGVNNESNYIHDWAIGNCNRQYMILSTLAFPTTTLAGSYNVTNAQPTQTNYLIAEFESTFAIRWASYLHSDSIYFERFGMDRANGRLYVTGSARAEDFYTVDPGNGAFYDGNKNMATATQYAAAIMEFNIGAPPVLAVQGGGNPTVCSGGSISLTATGNGTLNWYDAPSGGNLIGTGSPVSFTNITSTFTVYVESVEGSCTSPRDSLTVTVVSAPTVTASATATTICNGQNTTLNAGGATSYTWDNSLGSGSSHLVSPTTTTTYSVTGSDGTGCSNTATVTITVNTLSTAPTSVTAGINPICAGDATLLSVVGGSLGTGASWQWFTGSCGGTGAGSGTTLNVSPGSTTTYFAQAIGTCNTTSCASVTITVNTGSIAPTSISAATNPLCLGENTNLTAQGGTLGTGASYVWYTGSCGGTPAGNGLSINVNPTVNTSYYVLAMGTCDTTLCASLNLNVTDVAAYAGLDQTICVGDSVTLTATGNGSFLWSNGGATTASITVNPATTTTYTVTVTNGSCSESADVTVNITTQADATIISTGPYCLSESPLNLSATDPGGVWSGTGITNPLNGTFDPSTAGLGTHQIIYSISGSCGDSDTVNIDVIDNLDATILSAGPYCNNQSSVILSATTAGGNWSGQGITNPTTGDFSPQNLGVGSFTVIYTITGACGSADTATINVVASPSASVTATGESCMGEGDGTALVSASGGTPPYSYVWQTSATADLIINLAPGIYLVTVTDANSCQQIDTAIVAASGIECETVLPLIYVPNVFSPNGDGKNDVLYVRGQGISDFTLRIYNRWGEKVFESSDLNDGWNGIYKGKLLDNAVFVYTLTANFANGDSIDKKGNVSLIK